MILHYANWPAPSHIKAFTTTINGGVSQGTYESLNLALHVDDDPERVLHNRALLTEQAELPSSPIWLNQVHSTDVIELTDQYRDIRRSNPEPQLADGAYTRNAKQVCAVLTADCLPLFLSNKNGDQVAVLHVGWRGLAKGMIETGISAFDCDAKDIIAWAGPCIGPNSFEIGDDVRQQLGGPDEAYRISKNASDSAPKWLANLYHLTGQRLAKLGIGQYLHSSACTFRDKDLFFSYRRTGQCGRMASLIWIDQ